MQLWTIGHGKTILPALAIMVAISLLLRRWLVHRPLRQRMIPLQVIGVFLVLIEIGKQAVSVYRGYDLYHIPLHVCSLALFTLPTMAFYRGRHANAIRGIGTGICTAIFLLMLIYPNLIYSEDNIRGFFEDYLDFHTVAFHNAVLLAVLLMYALELYRPQKKGEGKALVIFTGIYCLIAATMAQLLKTNYANFYTCNIPPLENLRQSVVKAVGNLTAQVLYALIVSVLTIAFIYGAYRLYCLIVPKVRITTR
jgi:hypothetical protein